MKQFSKKIIILAGLVLISAVFAPLLLRVVHAQTANQMTVQVGTAVSFYASGGNGGSSGNGYAWTAPSSFVPPSGSGINFNSTPQKAGNSQVVTVRDSSGNTASCIVNVTSTPPTTPPSLSPPTGTISANPSTCTIVSGQTTCSSTITWSTNNVTSSNVYVVVSAPGTTANFSHWFDNRGSGAGVAPWITTQGDTFDLDICSGVGSLFTCSKKLASVTVYGKAGSGNVCSAEPSIASFTANGGTNITVNPGPNPVTYQWSSSNGTSFEWSGHDENNNPIATCDSADPGFSICDTASGIITSGPISASAIGHTYTITFLASALSCSIASKSVTVKVVAVGTTPIITTPTSTTPTTSQHSWLCWEPPTTPYVCVNVGGPETGQIVDNSNCTGLAQPSCGSNTTTTPQTHLACEGDACTAIAGPGTNSCTNDGNCGTGATHLACLNNSCATVPGFGADTCVNNSNCGIGATHYACVNNACSEVFGSGADQCNSNSDCVIGNGSHDACEGDACTLVSGSGTSTCTTDANCGTGATHSICSEASCVQLSGGGVNQCASNADCSIGDDTYSVCRNYSCESIIGSGTNQCSVDSDCSGGPTSGGAPQWSCNSSNQAVCLDAGNSVPSSDCTGQAPSCPGGGGGGSTHLACGSNNTCTVVAGSGSNTCAMAGDACSGGGTPVVSCVLSANPSTILIPQQSTLQWTCQNAVSCTMTPNGQAVSPSTGSEIVSPGATTVYTLTCLNNANTSGNFQTTIVVQPNPTVSETNP